jgi:hypothetical protein
LYLDNDQAAPILRKAGISPYEGYDWELVQTHLIFPDGHIEEFWRPTENGGSTDPPALKKALKDAIKKYNLNKFETPLTSYAQRKGTVSGVRILTIVRVPPQKNYPVDASYGIDWIVIPENKLSELYPPTPDTISYEIPRDLAEEILIQFRIPLETDIDLDKDAKSHIKKISLSATQIPSQQGIKKILFQGMVRMEDPRQLQSFESATDKWIKRVVEEIHISGYLLLNEESKAIEKFHFNIDDAYLIPPNKKKISFVGVGHLVPTMNEL